MVFLVSKLIKQVVDVCTRDDMNAFYYSTYGLTCTDVIDIVFRILFYDEDIEVDMCERILEDFE